MTEPAPPPERGRSAKEGPRPSPLREAVFRFRGALLALVAAPIAAATLSPRAPEPWELALGLALLALGCGTRLVAVRWIGKRARVRQSGAAHLLCEGPFARVRNPLYVGNLAIAAGAAVLSGLERWAPLAVLYVWAVYGFVVAAEEVTLGDLFGERYQEYLRRVPRWLPRLTPAAKIEESEAPVHPWAQVLAREGPTMLLGVGVAAAAILYARFEGPGVASLRAVIDRGAETVHAPRVVLLLVVVLAIAAGEAFVTDRKRKRHERNRALYGNAAPAPPASDPTRS